MEELKTFAETLRRLRSSRGLSQAQLAKESGIPQASISRWETGAEPGLLSIRQLAQFFQVSCDALCGLSSPPDSLRAGNWLIDLDALEDWRATKSRAGEAWAVAIPDRYRIVTSSEYQKLRSEAYNRGKR